MEKILNGSDESRRITFTQSSVDLRLTMSYSCVITGGRRSNHTTTPLQCI